ncbi:KTSC domain-containing protein [Kribbella sp. NBC_01245]|uniref:KTSC domain-containing protein n=1 Tax=Kribbella sp. NBC_01245 TaxID=2903578 RepID=UPI002E28CBA4|nr:KTSC domain-containing protein [Kribbella sp. NBC_01245]
MKREPVNSASIRSVGYDVESSVLEVEFVSGDVYRYLDVPQLVHKQLMTSESIGRFLNSRVKPNYAVVDLWNRA